MTKILMKNTVHALLAISLMIGGIGTYALEHQEVTIVSSEEGGALREIVLQKSYSRSVLWDWAAQ